jgi:hypothetical protein
MSTKEQRDIAQATDAQMRADMAANRARVVQLCVELGHAFVVSEAAQAWATYVPPPAERGLAPMRYSGVATWLSSLLRGFRRAADFEKAVGGVVAQGTVAGTMAVALSRMCASITVDPDGTHRVEYVDPEAPAQTTLLDLSQKSGEP